MKKRLKPWTQTGDLTEGERWKLAQELVKQLTDAPPGSYATALRGNSFVVALVDKNGQLQVYDTMIRASLEEDRPREQTLFEAQGSGKVNTFSRRCPRS